MSVKSYRDLLVWQKAILATKMVYWLVKRLPREELFALSNQMRRAAISIPSNIAEGHARNSTKEFLQFLSIAKGSKAELETQLILCVEINYLSPDDIAPIMALLEEIGRMISGLVISLSHSTIHSSQPTINGIQRTTYSPYQFLPHQLYQPAVPSSQPPLATSTPPSYPYPLNFPPNP